MIKIVSPIHERFQNAIYRKPAIRPKRNERAWSVCSSPSRNVSLFSSGDPWPISLRIRVLLSMHDAAMGRAKGVVHIQIAEFRDASENVGRSFLLPAGTGRSDSADVRRSHVTVFFRHRPIVS